MSDRKVWPASKEPKDLGALENLDIVYMRGEKYYVHSINIDVHGNAQVTLMRFKEDQL